jgi:hypothetical protein
MARLDELQGLAERRYSNGHQPMKLIEAETLPN